MQGYCTCKFSTWNLIGIVLNTFLLEWRSKAIKRHQRADTFCSVVFLKPFPLFCIMKVCRNVSQIVRMPHKLSVLVFSDIRVAICLTGPSLGKMLSALVFYSSLWQFVFTASTPFCYILGRDHREGNDILVRAWIKDLKTSVRSHMYPALPPRWCLPLSPRCLPPDASRKH